MDSTPTKMNIVLLFDSSGSMLSMGDEAVQSVNEIIAGQKESALGATFTLLTFSLGMRTVIDSVPIEDVVEMKQSDYHPSGGTALCDAICLTIEERLESPTVLIVVTDGEENSSSRRSGKDVGNIVRDAEENYGWKVILVGANIDVISTGSQYNIGLNRCADFDQSIPGNLTSLCREISSEVAGFRRAYSIGDDAADIVLTRQNAKYVNRFQRSLSPIATQDPWSDDLPPHPPVMTRSVGRQFAT